MKTILLVWASVIGCLVLTSGHVRAQQPDEQIKRVFADWEKRREAIKRIRYVVTGQSITPKGSMTDDTGLPLAIPHPPKDIAMRQDSVFLFDLENKRFRLEMAGEKYYRNQQQTAPWATTTLFDSKTIFEEIPREANENTLAPRMPTEPDVTLAQSYPRPLMLVSASHLSPLLMAHGIVPRWTEPAQFGKLPDPDDFTVHGRHIFKGRDCLVLRTFPERGGSTTSFDEFWIDTGHDSAVVHQASYDDDKLREFVEIDYQQTPHGWLPLQWTGTYRRDGVQATNVTRLTVKELNIEPPVSDNDFKPEIKPGMYVYETIYSAQGSPIKLILPKVYHVGSDGSWNEVIDGVEHKSRTWYWYGAVAIAAAVLMVAIGFWYRNRRRKDNTK